MGKKRPKTVTPTRRKPFREPRQRFLIVCGGSVTEPSYLEGVRQKCRDRLIKLDIVPGTRAPGAIVAQATKLSREENARAKDAFDRFDEVWCVFDKDQFDLQESIRFAEANGISLAVSNPCFELWLVLHFQDQAAYLTVAQARRLCQKYLQHYNKHVDIDRVWHNLQSAITRAQALDALHSRNGKQGTNPSTGIHHLIQRIERSQLRPIRS